MKKILLIFILLGASIIFQNGATIEKDFFQPDKLIIYDKDHKRTGTIEPDFFDPSKLIIYDDKNQKIGVIEKDFFNSDKWNIKMKGGK